MQWPNHAQQNTPIIAVYSRFYFKNRTIGCSEGQAGRLTTTAIFFRLSILAGNSLLLTRSFQTLCE